MPLLLALHWSSTVAQASLESRHDAFLLLKLHAIGPTKRKPKSSVKLKMIHYAFRAQPESSRGQQLFLKLWRRTDVRSGSSELAGL